MIALDNISLTIASWFAAILQASIPSRSARSTTRPADGSGPSEDRWSPGRYVEGQPARDTTSAVFRKVVGSRIGTSKEIGFALTLNAAEIAPVSGQNQRGRPHPRS